MTRPATRPQPDGLWYCTMCGKKWAKFADAEAHTRKEHRGYGDPVREPSRAQLLAAWVAATRLAEAARAHLHLSDCDTREQLGAHERLGDALDDFSNTVPEAKA